MFQAHIWWNKIEINAIKIYLYKSYKIDVLGMSKGRHLTDVFSQRFGDVQRKFLQNFKKKQKLTFKYFTQHIWWVGPKIIQQ